LGPILISVSIVVAIAASLLAFFLIGYFTPPEPPPTTTSDGTAWEEEIQPGARVVRIESSDTEPLDSLHFSNFREMILIHGDEVELEVTVDGEIEVIGLKPPSGAQPSEFDPSE